MSSDASARFHQRLLMLAPTRRAVSETFIRANVEGLPFQVSALFGDERPLRRPIALAYGLAILLSKVLTRMRLLRLAEMPAACVIWWVIGRQRPDAVLVDFGFEAVRVMEACAWRQVPLVVHFRGSDASADARLGLLRKRYQRLVSIAAGVVVKSRPMAETLQALGACPERMLISPSGANAKLFFGSEPAAAPPVFLAVGRFVEKKGPLHTIRAFAMVSEALGAETQDLALWMVGDGPLLPDAHALVRSLNLDARVRFFGSRDQRAVAQLMREVRGFVQHSRIAPDGDSEGNPVAVMEAQLSGLPVVATRHAGIPDVVLDGESGLLVAEGDEQGMAKAMARLAMDPALAAHLGDCGSCRVQGGFTVDHHLHQLAALLLKVMGESER